MKIKLIFTSLLFFSLNSSDLENEATRELIVFDGSSFLSPSTSRALSAIGVWNSGKLGMKFKGSQCKAEEYLFTKINLQYPSLEIRDRILFAVNMYGRSIPEALIAHLNGERTIEVSDSYAKILMSMLEPHNQQKIMNVDKDVVQIINSIHNEGKKVYVSTGLHTKVSQEIKERHFPSISYENVKSWFYSDQEATHEKIVLVTHKDKKPHIERLLRTRTSKYQVLTPEEFRRQFRRTKSGLSTQSKPNSNANNSN